jgi:membrane-associated protein
VLSVRRNRPLRPIPGYGGDRHPADPFGNRTQVAASECIHRLPSMHSEFRLGRYNDRAMDLIWILVDILLHLDRHLSEIIQQYGIWTYLILFLIVFCETGLVVTPFLPGDSLLFAVGTFAALGALDLWLVVALLIAAAILGDSVNYAIGARVGPRVFRQEGVRFLNRKHLDRTHEFYERYGAKTIVIARFVPIVRTFAPFVAGIGRMTYRRFLFYNVAGAVLWVAILVPGGYLFGNIPVVRRNFSLVIFAIIILSILPGVIEVWRQRGRAEKALR